VLLVFKTLPKTKSLASIVFWLREGRCPQAELNFQRQIPPEGDFIGPLNATNISLVIFYPLAQGAVQEPKFRRVHQQHKLGC